MTDQLRNESTLRSRVVLTAEVGAMATTRRTVVFVEHYEDDSSAQVVEMALEIAPSVEEWGRS